MYLSFYSLFNHQSIPDRPTATVTVV